MRLHTKLDREQILTALVKAKAAGHVADDVRFERLEEQPSSRTHDHQFEIQLGVPKALPYVPLPADYTNQYGKRQKTRRTTNGSANNYAATWHEWGWFMAELFEEDPESRWGSDPDRARHPWGYFSQQDFDAKTDYQFVIEAE